MDIHFSAESLLNLLNFLNNFSIYSEIKNIVILYDLKTISLVNEITSHNYESNLSWILFNMEHVEMATFPEVFNNQVLMWSYSQINLSDVRKLYAGLPKQETKHIFLLNTRNESENILIEAAISRFAYIEFNGIFVNWLDKITIYAWNDYFGLEKNYSPCKVLSEAQFLSNYSLYQQIFFNKWNPVAGTELTIYSYSFPSRSLFVRYSFDKENKTRLGGNEIMMASYIGEYLRSNTQFKCSSQPKITVRMLQPINNNHSVFSEFLDKQYTVFRRVQSTNNNK